MAHPSYLRQVARLIPPGVPVLQPPFAPFGSGYPRRVREAVPAGEGSAAPREKATPRTSRGKQAASVPVPPAAEAPPEPTGHAAEPLSESIAPSAPKGISSTAALPAAPDSVASLLSAPVTAAPAVPAATRDTRREFRAPAAVESGAAGGEARAVQPPPQEALAVDNARDDGRAEWMALRSPELSPPRGRSGQPIHSVHIGAIEVHIASPAARPPDVPPRAAPHGAAGAAPESRLSRGYLSSFGLRQG